VTINYYRVIYEVVDEIKAAMEGMLNPEVIEEITGEAKILQLFKVPKIGIIAGCQVTSGVVDRDSKVRLYRDGIEIGEAKVASLKRLKDDVKSVKSGLECGIGIDGIKEIKVDDVLAFFKLKEIAKKLSMSEA
jgi:translation initiation factor IF-2